MLAVARQIIEILVQHRVRRRWRGVMRVFLAILTAIFCHFAHGVADNASPSTRHLLLFYRE